MSESQQGPEICDVIGGKCYFVAFFDTDQEPYYGSCTNLMESAINFGTKKGTMLIWLQPKHIEHELEKLNESPAPEWTLALVTETSLAWTSRFYDEAPMN